MSYFKFSIFLEKVKKYKIIFTKYFIMYCLSKNILLYYVSKNSSHKKLLIIIVKH